MVDKNLGYKLPPKDHQFKKGQSGNPNGRPKGSISLKKLFYQELKNNIVLANGDVITKGEAIVKQTINGAAVGNILLTKIVLHYMDKFEQKSLFERFVNRFKKDHALSNKDIEAYALYNKNICLNSKKILNNLSINSIVSQKIAVSNVTSNSMLARLYDLFINQMIVNSAHEIILE